MQSDILRKKLIEMKRAGFMEVYTDALCDYLAWLESRLLKEPCPRCDNGDVCVTHARAPDPRPVVWANEISPFTGAQVKDLLDENEKLRAERDVWSGRACEEEQAAGNGPCGACRFCLPKLLAEARAECDTNRREVLQHREYTQNLLKAVLELCEEIDPHEVHKKGSDIEWIEGCRAGVQRFAHSNLAKRAEAAEAAHQDERRERQRFERWFEEQRVRAEAADAALITMRNECDKRVAEMLKRERSLELERDTARQSATEKFVKMERVVEAAREVRKGGDAYAFVKLYQALEEIG